VAELIQKMRDTEMFLCFFYGNQGAEIFPLRIAPRKEFSNQKGKNI